MCGPDSVEIECEDFLSFGFDEGLWNVADEFGVFGCKFFYIGFVDTGIDGCEKVFGTGEDYVVAIFSLQIFFEENEAAFYFLFDIGVFFFEDVLEIVDPGYARYYFCRRGSGRRRNSRR